MNKKLTILSLTSLFAVGALTGCQNENSKLAKEVVDSIKIGSDYKQAKGGFTLPSKILKDGQSYDIVWTDNSDLISVVEWDEAHDKVNVTRPKAGEANVDYTLTANVEVNGKKASKDFSGVISAYEVNPIAYTKVADLVADAKANKLEGKTFSLTGNIATSTNAGLWVVGEDEEAFFAYGAQASYKKGDNVTLTGTLAKYHSLYQFDKGFSVEGHSRGNEVEFKKHTPAEMTVGELFDLDPKLGDPIHGRQLKVKGVVSVEKSGDFTNYYIKDLNDATKKHQFYYKSITDEQKAALDKVDGKVASVNVVYYTNNDSEKAYLDFYDSLELTGAALTAEELFHFSASSFSVPSTIAGNLPTEFKWETGKDAEGEPVLDSATVKYDALPAGYVTADGKVTVPLEPVQLEKLDVTITKGEIEHKLTFTPKVGIVYTDLKTVFAEKNMDETSYVKGYVLYAQYQDGIILDKDGNPYIVRLNEDEGKDSKFKTGNEVTLEGKYGEYKGKSQYGSDSLIGTKAEKAVEVNVKGAKEVTAEQLTAAAAAAKAGVAGDKLSENAAIKVFADQHLKLVKFTANHKYTPKTGNMKYDDHEIIGVPTKDEGLNMKDHFSLYPSDMKEDCEVTVYAIVQGFQRVDKPVTANTKEMNLVIVKIEKKAA